MNRALLNDKIENDSPEIMRDLALLESTPFSRHGAAPTRTPEQEIGYPLMYLAWYIAGLATLILVMAN